MSQTLEPEWDLFRSFRVALQEGSLSGAARVLGLTQPTINRHIDTLEEALGMKLFSRTSRGLVPTPTALELQPHLENIARNIAAMRSLASGDAQSSRGTVRVSASEMMGAEVLPPLFASLMRQHQGLEIELELSNRLKNLQQDDTDIAIRMQQPEQDGLLTRNVGSITLSLHAHRSYLDRQGIPRSAADLTHHAIIGFDQDSPFSQQIRKRFPLVNDLNFAFRSNSDLAQFAALRNGAGIGLCQKKIAARMPDIEPVLPGILDIQLPICVVMKVEKKTIQRYKVAFEAIVDYLTEYGAD